MDTKRDLITKEYDYTIISFWFWADQFLMAGQVENGELWLVNNFINVKYNPDWFPSGIYFANNEYRNKMVEFYDCPYLLMQKLMHGEDKKFGTDDIIDILLENISQNRYVIFMVDRLYLNTGWKRSNEHQIMVHGYDISEKKIYFADHLTNGKYKTGLTCSFDEMKQAFEASLTYFEEPEFKNTIFTFSPVENSSYKLNLGHIINQLEYYNNGNQDLYDDYYKNGIQVYSDLASYFKKEIVNKTAIIDVRGVTVLLDHNSAMVFRIKYFELVMKRNFESLKMYEELKADSERLVMLYVKYGIKRDYAILSRIVEMLYTLEQREKQALKLLFNELCMTDISSIEMSDVKKEKELKDVVLMMCTSGTTGMPKAIKFHTEAVLYNIRAISSYFQISEADTILISRPLYHCAVLVGELLLSIYSGTNILFYSDGFNPIRLSGIIEKNNVTVMCGTPTIFKGMASYMNHKNIVGELRKIALSGEYLLEECADEIRKAFPKTEIYNVYGLTEAGPRVSYLPCEKFSEKPQSVGQALPGIDIRLVDEKNNEITKCNTQGRIWIETPSLMKGYYRNNREYIAENKWFDTGDIGFFDEEGLLYILGRSDDMIIKAGMNIYPQEIERRVLKLPEIKEILVYGKFVYGTEKIIADVILEKQYAFLKSFDIMQKLEYILPDYLMPAELNIVKELPRNGSGKVVRPSKKVRDISD